MEFIIRLLLNAVAVVGASYLLSGIHVKNFKYAILVALVLSILNVFLKPFLVFLTFPITLVTLGLFLLIINAAIIQVASWLIGSGFSVDGWLWAVAFSIVLVILNSILESVFGV
jgi:putative membrane protein